ncbi:MAG: HAD hydrolase-like protein [Planctomycetes bacterium]|nr:HAD hydrolase-like protein [Planctomycetota bacterium]
MAGITAIIYDLDGTLIDSAADIAVALNRVRDHYALPALDEWEVRSFIGGGARRLLERGVLGIVEDPALRPARHLPRTGADMQEMMDLFVGFYSEDPVIDTKLVPGVEKALRHWQKEGAAQVILTNKPLRIAEEILRRLGVINYFELVIGGGALDDEGNPLPLKPDPSLVDYILDQTGAPREETVMVGDGLPDLALARAARIRCLAILCGYTEPAVLIEQAIDLDWIATSFVAADEFLRAQA